jgi:DnaK suppressor protein
MDEGEAMNDPTPAPGEDSPGYRAGSTEAHAFEEALRDRYRELWADVQRELGKREAYSDLVQQLADPDDLATADLLVDLDIAEITRDLREMRDVQHALERLSRGAYGICEDCGEPIAPARLRVMPQATLCIDCQARREKMQPPAPTL